MERYLITFVISASILTAAGVIFFVLLVVKMNNMQVQARKSYLRDLIRDRDLTMAIVAREVHDNMKQMLYMARKSLLSIEGQATGQKKTALHQTGKILDQVIFEAGSISSTLDPDAVIQLGLAQAFVRLSDWLNQSGRPDCRLQVHYPGSALPAETELAIFRVAQEAVQNVLRHAKAGQVDLAFSCTSEKGFRLSVQDDGVGIPQDGPIDARMRMGLRNMRQRAEMLGARLQIDSSPGVGTRVELVFPGTESDALSSSMQ